MAGRKATVDCIAENYYNSSAKDGGVQWMADDESTTCVLCHKKFGITRRKHHCRRCGVLCCDDCSNYKLKVGDKNERACKTCWDDYKETERVEEQNRARTDSDNAKYVGGVNIKGTCLVQNCPFPRLHTKTSFGYCALHHKRHSLSSQPPPDPKRENEDAKNKLQSIYDYYCFYDAKKNKLTLEVWLKAATDLQFSNVELKSGTVKELFQESVGKGGDNMLKPQFVAAMQTIAVAKYPKVVGSAGGGMLHPALVMWIKELERAGNLDAITMLSQWAPHTRLLRADSAQDGIGSLRPISDVKDIKISPTGNL